MSLLLEDGQSIHMGFVCMFVNEVSSVGDLGNCKGDHLIQTMVKDSRDFKVEYEGCIILNSSVCMTGVGKAL